MMISYIKRWKEQNELRAVEWDATGIFLKKFSMFKLWKSLFTVKTKKNPFLNKNKNIPKTKKIIHPVYNSISHILYLLVTASKQSNSIKCWHRVKHPDPRNCVFMAAALNQAEIC